MADPRRCPLSKYRGKGTCKWCGKALTGRQTAWCGKKCPQLWAENHMYSQARKVVRRRDKYRCVLCGGGDPIEVDHAERAFGSHSKVSCSHHQSNLRVLCRVCHLEKTRLDRARDKR